MKGGTTNEKPQNVFVKEYIVYMLHCRDGSYYTGVTNNMELRLAQHERGDDVSCYTFKRRPVTLDYQCSFRDVFDAIAYETKLKGWSRRKKEALIRQEYGSLCRLASCPNATNFHLYKNIMCHTERSRSATHTCLSMHRVILRLRSE